MRHMKSGRKLSRRKAHREAMLANLAASIIKHEQVRTTEAKAKEVRPFIEKLITFARKGDLHARRIVLSRLKGDKSATHKLFEEIGPRYTSRPGGYTRILKLGFRSGDNAPISLIEFVQDEEKVSASKAKPKKKKAAPKATAAPKTVEVVEEVADVEETAAEETAVKEVSAEAAPAPEAAPAVEEAAVEDDKAEGKKEE